MKSTEFVKTSGEVSYGFDLPEPIYGHCALKTFEKENRVFIIGGYNGHDIGTTRIYLATDSSTYYEQDGPSLNIERFYHGCTIFASKNHDDRQVALVAGGANSAAVYDIELWDYQMPGSTWIKSNLKLNEQNIIPQVYL